VSGHYRWESRGPGVQGPGSVTPKQRITIKVIRDTTSEKNKNRHFGVRYL
jgi:hypothetical protein